MKRIKISLNNRDAIYVCLCGNPGCQKVTSTRGEGQISKEAWSLLNSDDLNVAIIQDKQSGYKVVAEYQKPKPTIRTPLLPFFYTSIQEIRSIEFLTNSDLSSRYQTTTRS